MEVNELPLCHQSDSLWETKHVTGGLEERGIMTWIHRQAPREMNIRITATLSHPSISNVIYARGPKSRNISEELPQAFWVFFFIKKKQTPKLSLLKGAKKTHGFWDHNKKRCVGVALWPWGLAFARQDRSPVFKSPGRASLNVEIRILFSWIFFLLSSLLVGGIWMSSPIGKG